MNILEAFWGEDGFETLNEAVKMHGNFTFQFIELMEKRFYIEETYANALAELANFIHQNCGNVEGSLPELVSMIGKMFSFESSCHRHFMDRLNGGIIEHLRRITDAHVKDVNQANFDLRDTINRLDGAKQNNFAMRSNDLKLLLRGNTLIGKLQNAEKTKKIAKWENELDATRFQGDKNIYDMLISGQEVELSRQEMELQMCDSIEGLSLAEEKRINSTKTVVIELANLMQKLYDEQSGMKDNLASIVSSCKAKEESSADHKNHMDLIIRKYGKRSFPEPQMLLYDFAVEYVDVDQEFKEAILKKGIAFMRHGMKKTATTTTAQKQLPFKELNVENTKISKRVDVRQLGNELLNLLFYLSYYKFAEKIPNFPHGPKRVDAHFVETFDRQGILFTYATLPYEYSFSSKISKLKLQMKGTKKEPNLFMVGRQHGHSSRYPRLHVHEDDVVKILKKGSEGWLLGEVNGRIGWIRDKEGRFIYDTNY